MGYEEYEYVDRDLQELKDELKQINSKLAATNREDSDLEKRIWEIEDEIEDRVYPEDTTTRVRVRVKTSTLTKPREEFHKAGCVRISSDDPYEELYLIVANRMFPTYGRFPDAREDVYKCPECEADITLLKIA